MNNNKELKANLKANKKALKAQRKFYQKKRFIIPAVIIVFALFNMGDVEEGYKDGVADAPKTTTEVKAVAEVEKAPEVAKELTPDQIEAQKVAEAKEKAEKDAKAKAEADAKAKAEADAKLPKEFKSALKSGQTYGERMNMSKKGIYDQLTSEYGGQFSKESAQYAIDNVEVDWKANALAQGQNYQDTMNMSPKAVYDQLVSQYGGQFTKAEAQHAIDNLE